MYNIVLIAYNYTYLFQNLKQLKDENYALRKLYSCLILLRPMFLRSYYIYVKFARKVLLLLRVRNV